MKRKSKNSILIIGNGFDLAHELKTSYNDFANAFVENRIVPELMESLNTKDFQNPFFKKQFLKTFINNRVNRLDNYHDYISYYALRNEIEKLTDYITENKNIINAIISNNFLGKLYSNGYMNWFDIENAYFKELVTFKNHLLNEKLNFSKEKLIELNNEFQFIKIELIEYLKTIEISKNADINKFLKSLISYEPSENFYIINFNYTNTIEQYLEPYIGLSNIGLNYIHGNLANENIIFGYGNDQNSDYQEIKNIEIDEFLKYFKTFEYLKNNKYSKIYENSIDRFQDYEVYILGHSLGLSDKTLLEEILNTEKCKKIHLFKRNDLIENTEVVQVMFNKLLFAASRIIGNEKNLRKTIKNYEDSTFFPELIKKPVANNV